MPNGGGISPEEVEEAIEKVARKIIDIGMGEVAVLALGLGYPFAYIGGQMGRVLISPYSVLFGKYEDSFNKYITIFEKRENIAKLINRLNDLIEEKREENKKRKEKAKNNGTAKRGRLSGLWDRLRGIHPRKPIA